MKMRAFVAAALPRTCVRLFCLAVLLGSARAADPKTHIDSAGLYGLLPTNVAVTDSRVTGFLNHADFAGVSVRTFWANIEGTQDVYDWSYYDSMIAAAQTAGKKVVLRLEAAWASPQWLFNLIPANELYSYTEQHSPVNPVKMPAPWNTTYLTHWKNFIQAMGAKYNGNATVAAVLVSGCSRSTEMYLPDTVTSWSVSPFLYTPQKLIDAWDGVIDTWATSFPDKPIYLSFSKPLADDGVVEAVAAYGVTTYPWQFCGKISFWNNTNDPSFYPLAALIGIVDDYTHGGLEPAGAAAGDIDATAISNAISWHTLGVFEVYYAQRNNFSGLKAEIDAHRDMINKMTFTATPQNGQVQLAWTVGSPNPYATGFKVLRKTGDFPAGISDPAATSVYDGNNTGGITDTGLTNGTTYYYSVFDKTSSYVVAQATAVPAAGGGGQTTVTFISTASEDGYVLESSETSGVGGTFSATAAGSSALRVGDDLADKQYKSIVSFDTSSLPDGATIVSATLRLKQGTVSGTSPFTTHGTCYVDIKKAPFGAAALEASDFQAAGSHAQTATMSNPGGNGNWSTGSVSATGLNFVNTTGKTQFRIYFSLDDNDDSGTDFLGFWAGEGATGDQPELVVTYQ